MINIENMTNSKIVNEQYSNTHNLEIRKSLHEKYSVNKIGFQKWQFDQYAFAPNLKVLELGSGRGELWNYYFENEQLMNFNMEITLSDFADGMVSYLQDIYKKESFHIQNIDICNIPYKNDTFDLVIANSMLYHVHNIDLALSEVKRVMKKNAVFYTSTLGLNGMTQYLYHAFDHLGIPYENGINISFTMQNGMEQLKKHFSKVEKRDYEDSLKIDKIEDYLDYIYSMASLKGLDRKYYPILKEYFESKKVGGYLSVPKEYGMFIVTK